MRFYTTDQLSPNQHLTPEGFLLCKDVAIGRTGEMLYAAGEIPIKAGTDGLIRISREADAVFHEDTIASFQGKPITLDHPGSDVNPRNWTELAKGIVQHVRRGEGASDGLLLSDLLITDETAIKSVRAGLRQVSCGYDAEYEQIEAGRGRQRNIIGNHVALVEKGRCGERCAIGDKETMPNDKQPTLKERFRNIFHANDAVSFETLLKDIPDTAAPAATADGALTLNAISGLFTAFESKINTRFTDMEKRIKARDADDPDDEEAKKRKRKREEEEEEEEAERKRKKAAGETEDDEEERRKSARSRKTRCPRGTLCRMCWHARKSCRLASVFPPSTQQQSQRRCVTASAPYGARRSTKYTDTANGRTAVLALVGGKEPDFKAMTCDAVSTVFTAASEIAKRENNYHVVMNRDSVQRTKDQYGTIAEINKKNKEFWDARTAR